MTPCFAVFGVDTHKLVHAASHRQGKTFLSATPTNHEHEMYKKARGNRELLPACLLQELLRYLSPKDTAHFSLVDKSTHRDLGDLAWIVPEQANLIRSRKRLSDLRVVQLQASQLMILGMALVDSAPQLSTLCVRSSWIDLESCWDILADLPKLRFLSLTACRVETSHVARLNLLETLVLERCLVTNQNPARESQIKILYINDGDVDLKLGMFTTLQRCVFVGKHDKKKLQLPPSIEDLDFNGRHFNLDLSHLVCLRSLSVHQFVPTDAINDFTYLLPRLEELRVGVIKTLRKTRPFMPANVSICLFNGADLEWFLTQYDWTRTHTLRIDVSWSSKAELPVSPVLRRFRTLHLARPATTELLDLLRGSCVERLGLWPPADSIYLAPNADMRLYLEKFPNWFK